MFKMTLLSAFEQSRLFDNKSTVVNSIESIVAHLKWHDITDKAAFVTLICSSIITIVTA